MMQEALLNALRGVVEAIDAAGGDAWKATTIDASVDQLANRTVLLIPTRVTSRRINASSARSELHVLALVRSRLVTETTTRTAYAEVDADVRAVLDAFGEMDLRGVGGATFEQRVRETVNYFYWPTGDAGRPAGGVLGLVLSWQE